MRYPQLVIVEPEERLSGLLRDLATQHQWTLREARSPESCLRFLRQSAASVAVIKPGANADKELRLLERCSMLFPDVPTVFVSESEGTPVNGLAWDLGAHCVFATSQPREHLAEIVAGLMEAAMAVSGMGNAAAPTV